ncbi:MAG: hypothetical protein AN484_27265, partial [Aphanizomenon flos-aquae WA102]
NETKPDLWIIGIIRYQLERGHGCGEMLTRGDVRGELTRGELIRGELRHTAYTIFRLSSEKKTRVDFQLKYYLTPMCTVYNFLNAMYAMGKVYNTKVIQCNECKEKLIHLKVHNAIKMQGNFYH